MSGGLSFQPSAGIGTNAISAFPVSTGDSLYGGFNPFDDANANQAFEIPGGGLGGFTPAGLGTSSAVGGATMGGGSSNGASAGLGISSAGGAGSAGGDTCGTFSWAGVTDCFNNPSSIFPGGIPGTPGTGAGGVNQSCSAANLGGCLPTLGDFFTRALVVVLGFIFVAAGLFMFGRTVPFVRHAVPNVLKP
jgi:hypothetical protein